MNNFPLSIQVGATARRILAENGWHPDIFGSVVGASGGAKLLGLTHLDRYVFGEYLASGSAPLSLYGSSIGSWRHAAAAAPDPVAALTILQERYLNQTWDENDQRHPREVVDSLCEWVLDGLLTPALVEHLINHPRFTSHIVTARGTGLANRPADAALALGMGAAAIGNLVSRRLLQKSFQRVVFSSGDSKEFVFSDFSTHHAALTTKTLKSALTASGSIPFLMSGVTNIDDAPAGQYWDGGIIDYHFDFTNHVSDKLVLYPHFGSNVIKGWFDKQLPWRRNSMALLDRTIVVAPSQQYLSELPNGKIPDRKDFARLSNDQRLDNWQRAMAQSQQLADAMNDVVNASDPLKHVNA